MSEDVIVPKDSIKWFELHAIKKYIERDAVFDVQASQAISLKRIADALEAIVKLGQPPYMVSGAVLNPDPMPYGVIHGEHTGDTRRPKESP